MGTIEGKVLETILEGKQKFANDDKIIEFENTLKEFQLLIEKGVADKRGYRLISATDAHLKAQVSFNLK